MADKLSAEQLDALQRVKRVHGRTWKSKLSDAWMTGNYRAIGMESHSHLLQQVRNDFGPSWLYSKNCEV